MQILGTYHKSTTLLLDLAKWVPGGKLRPREFQYLAYGHIVRRLRISKKPYFPRYA